MKIYFLLLLFVFSFKTPCFAENSAIKYLPVQHEGRIKPLDTVARNSLLLLHGSQKLNDQGKRISAIDWLLDVMMNSKKAKNIKLIRVENKDLLTFLGSKSEKTVYYSISELQPHFEKIYLLSSQALNIEENDQDAFQKASVVLWQQITIYLRLANTFWISEIENIPSEFADFKRAIQNETRSGFLNKGAERNPVTLQWYQQRYQFLEKVSFFHLLPPIIGNDRWSNMGEGLLAGIHDQHFHPSINQIIDMIFAYQKRSGNFDQLVNNYIHEVHKFVPNLKTRVKIEVLYNTIQPFFVASIVYLGVILISVVSWFFNYDKLIKMSFVLFILGSLLHGFGLLARMYIEGRPPVTNLYSSAIFVGFSAVIFSLFFEYKHRNGLGCVAGASIGAMTLIVAHHLALNTDTLEVVRAVLNSNFWLSTHVVTITLGYSSTFVAGSLAMMYILRGFFTQGLDIKTSNTIAGMVYKTVCFSTFFSFVGTILGGFWADQSWGRFWGWDPKENGALLIILWNVLILHAKIAGYIKNQGLMLLAVFGNVVTAFSWFGVNILSVGLHSYGFFTGTFFWLMVFVFSQIVVMAIGLLPQCYWRSRKAKLGKPRP